jgi:hypothetical protein
MPALMTSQMLQDDLAFVEERLREHQEPYDTVRFMWEQRRAALLEEIKDLQSRHDTHAEVALMFDGTPVKGSEEIRLDFATKILDNYQLVVSTLVAERAGAELHAKGKLPRSFASKLYIRDMARGSVGFILEEPRQQQSGLLPSVLKDAVDETTNVLQDLSGADVDKFYTRLQKLSPRTIGAVKKMAKSLHDSGAITKIVSDVVEFRLDSNSTNSLYQRLTEVEVAETHETQIGTLLGVFPDRQQYEFKLEDGQVFYGPVSETLNARYLADREFARSILLQVVTATFLLVTTLRAGQLQSQEKILEDVQLGGTRLLVQS